MGREGAEARGGVETKIRQKNLPKGAKMRNSEKKFKHVFCWWHENKNVGRAGRAASQRAWLKYSIIYCFICIPNVTNQR